MAIDEDWGLPSVAEQPPQGMSDKDEGLTTMLDRESLHSCLSWRRCALVPPSSTAAMTERDHCSRRSPGS